MLGLISLKKSSASAFLRNGLETIIVCDGSTFTGLLHFFIRVAVTSTDIGFALTVTHHTLKPIIVITFIAFSRPLLNVLLYLLIELLDFAIVYFVKL